MNTLVKLMLSATALLAAAVVQAQLLSPEATRAGDQVNSRNARQQDVPTLNILNEKSSERINPEVQLPPASAAASAAQVTPAGRGNRSGEATTTEFSRYASKLVGRELPVIGKDFFARLTPSAAAAAPAVPPDYVVNAGDELLIQVSGSFEAEFRQQVRRGGDISLPRVGAVRVAGVPAAELSAYVRTRLATQFKDFQVSVSFVALRGMRVFVTGFVSAPGPHIVDNLSTLTAAIAAAGGPAEGGSFRAAELWRKGKKLATFDLYQFLIRGDNSADASLTGDDVIRVQPASPFQVAITGSVNRPGVYELLPGETLQSLLEFAGGLSPIADTQRLAAVELDPKGQRKLVEIPADSSQGFRLSPGTVLHVFTGATLSQSLQSSAKIVHVEGEVLRPGSYVMSPQSSLKDALALAGGVTADAHLPGLSLVRADLARSQQVQFQMALDEIEKSVFESSSSMAGFGVETAQSHAALAASMRTYIERLRQFKPSGRLILPRPQDPASSSLVLLNDDRIVVPPKPRAVSIFGAVYGEGSFQADGPQKLSEVIKLAGGTRPGADERSIVVLHSDGTLSHAHRGVFDFAPPPLVDAGDTVLVPTDTQRGRLWVIVRDIGTMVYQFGLGVAAFRALN